MRRDRDISAVELAVAGPTPSGPHYPIDDLGQQEIEKMVEFYEEAWDNNMGKILPPELVKEARNVCHQSVWQSVEARDGGQRL